MNTFEIMVFEPSSRKASVTISSLIPEQCFAAFQKRFGLDATKKARDAHSAMDLVGMDLAQFKVGERRVRMKVA